MPKTFLLMLLTLTITSCATQNRKYNYTPKHSPTVEINNFKDETNKRHLDSVIVREKTTQNQKEFFLASKSTKTVDKWIKYFSTGGKRGFETFLTNGSKYRSVIEKIFAKHNLPADLYYVGLIESGYKNHAKSHAGAVGPWQFIKETARRYGLKVTRNIDERKNIYKSTEAAALYFQDLYNIFGSWELALAAYNAGEYGVIRRIRGANTRDFFELSEKKVLPAETRNYVPKIVAAKEVDQNKKRYNIKFRPDNTSLFKNAKSYQVKNSISLKKLSRKLGVSKSLIKKINHDIRGSYIPYLGRGGFEIYLPAKSYNATELDKWMVHNSESQVKEKNVIRSKKSKRKVSLSKSFHKVRKNESLFSISKRYNVTLRTLRKINNIKGSKIFVGQKIRLPKGLSSTKVLYSYTVKKGDHLTKIASMFRMPIGKLKKINKLKKTSIFIGQKLKVPAYKSKVHVVKSGEVLSKIASRYKVSLAQIKSFNAMRNSQIYPGQKIIVKLTKI